jgi:hypothetical protein
MTIQRRSTEASRRDALRIIAAAALAGAAVARPPSAAAAPATRSLETNAVHIEKGRPDMTQDLATLAAEHFEPLVGQSFNIGPYQVMLRNVRRAGRAGSRFREQFALVFSLPHEMPIRSELLPVAHPAIGRYDLLVTQIFDERDGSALEICFS